MKRRRQLLDCPEDDRGAALVLVLVVVTVIALAGAAMLSFSDTSIRTTVALRDQGAAAYAAEGAAQVAISELQQASFPNKCATQTGDALPLGNATNAFYKSAQSSSTALNAYVWCSPDAANGTGGGPTAANASPGNALLTLGTSIIDEDGIEIDSKAGPVKVRGGVFSNSTIYIKRGGLENTFTPPPASYVRARGACSRPDLITPAGWRECDYLDVDPLGTDPGTLTPHGASYDPPAAPTANGTIGTCAGNAKYQQLTPGRYTSASALNGVTGCSSKLVILSHGTYFFDFKDGGNQSHTWTVDHTNVVAGTPTISLTRTPTVADMLTACVTPEDAAATNSSGVRFVFGGDSQLRLKDSNGNSGGQFTICASRSANGPPIAISGQKTALVGSLSVAAQGGCITSTSNNPCRLIEADLSPDTNLTVQGTTYTPKAWVDLSLTDGTNQVFRWGLIARALSIAANPRANLDFPVVDVPDAAASSTPVPDIMYLSVYVCPGTAPCSKAGALRLTAKVQVGDTAVTVLSWSVKR